MEFIGFAVRSVHQIPQLPSSMSSNHKKKSQLRQIFYFCNPSKHWTSALHVLQLLPIYSLQQHLPRQKPSLSSSKLILNPSLQSKNQNPTPSPSSYPTKATTATATAITTTTTTPTTATYSSHKSPFLHPTPLSSPPPHSQRKHQFPNPPPIPLHHTLPPFPIPIPRHKNTSTRPLPPLPKKRTAHSL